VQQERSGHGDRPAQQQRQHEAFADRARRLQRATFAVTTGSDGIEADADHLANGDHEPDPEDRTRGSGECIGAERTSDPIHVHVVKRGHEQIGDDRRQRHAANREG
jgi:hypothetical protein